MRDEDKPFVCYRRGRWQMSIEPRGMAGWRALGWWFVPLLAMTGAHLALVSSLAEGDPLIGWSTAGMVLLATVWAIALIRWTYARSEVVDMNDLLRLKRQRDKQGKRRS